MRPDMLAGFVETKNFYVFFEKKIYILLRYPAKLLAGYPAKSVSGTVLISGAIRPEGQTGNHIDEQLLRRVLVSQMKCDKDLFLVLTRGIDL